VTNSPGKVPASLRSDGVSACLAGPLMDVNRLTQSDTMITELALTINRRAAQQELRDSLVSVLHS
jgi:hypothetical protein